MNAVFKPVRTTVFLLLVLVAVPECCVAARAYIFTAPPRGTAKKEAAVYQPIADYLTRTLGKPVIYEYPDNWLTYQKQMQENHYDIVFDGPHFIGWRMARLRHVPLVKLPGKLKFVVFVNAKDHRVNSLQDLRGHTVCGLAPPNLATLTMFRQFPNPAQQPLVIGVRSFPQDYDMVLKGRCDAGVMRDKMFLKLQKSHAQGARMVWYSKGTTNQGFSASSRVAPADRGKIIAALTAPTAQGPLTPFFNRFSKKNRKLLPAKTSDYAGQDAYLRNTYGFAR